ncbi:MAG: hypothetical protein ACK45T_24965 [Pseudanabaena sp.]
MYNVVFPHHVLGLPDFPFSLVQQQCLIERAGHDAHLRTSVNHS